MKATIIIALNADRTTMLEWFGWFVAVAATHCEALCITSITTMKCVQWQKQCTLCDTSWARTQRHQQARAMRPPLRLRGWRAAANNPFNDLFTFIFNIQIWHLHTVCAHATTRHLIRMCEQFRMRITECFPFADTQLFRPTNGKMHVTDAADK